MALLNTDLFVIQRPTDSGKHYKLTGDALKAFIESGESVNYRGSRDFRDASADPSTDGTGVNNGDLYINSNAVLGDGEWAASINGVTVEQGDRAIWNGGTNRWDLIKSDTGDHGVENIVGTQPILVDDSIYETPTVSVYEAASTDDSLLAPRTTRSGVVSAIASAGDVAPNAGTSSPNPDAVVPASLLKLVAEDLDELVKGGGLASLLGTDPIEVTTTPPDANGNTATTVSIKDATTAQKGATTLQEVGAAVDTGTTTAATPGYVDAYYLVQKFSSLQDA